MNPKNPFSKKSYRQSLSKLNKRTVFSIESIHRRRNSCLRMQNLNFRVQKFIYFRVLNLQDEALHHEPRQLGVPVQQEDGQRAPAARTGARRPIRSRARHGRTTAVSSVITKGDGHIFCSLQLWHVKSHRAHVLYPVFQEESISEKKKAKKILPGVKNAFFGQNWPKK